MPSIHDAGALEAPIAVVGDIHLSVARPDVTKAFHRWLDAHRTSFRTLILLGDIFDYWVKEPRTRSPMIQQTLHRLAAMATAGTQLIFQPGNRDFLFRGIEGLPLTMWPDVVRAAWGTTRVLLTHGDLLCTADHAYLRYRRVVRSRGVTGAVNLMPRPLLEYLGAGMRRLSKRATRRKSTQTMGLDYGAAAAWLAEANCDVMVAGHVHTGVQHLCADGSRSIYVLKDWNPHGSVIEFDGRDILFASSSVS